MDEAARLQAATAEGEARGEARGEAIGRVRLPQQLIGLPVATPEALQRQLRERG